MRALLVAALFAGCAPLPAPETTSGALHGDGFTITMWCGPPMDVLDDARVAAIAAAGFDVLGPPCEGPRSVAHNRRALELAARHGLSVWIADDRLDAAVRGAADAESLVRAVVRDHGDHPALGGYFVHDEPGPADLPRVGAVVDLLRRADPVRLAYVNLLPGYAFEGGAAHARYVDAALRVGHVRLLSYDHYPLLAGSDRPSFFEDLARVSMAAAVHRVPFLLIVQAMPHGDYRDPTAAELGWQVFHALAYGARGVSYFAYWTPVDVPGQARWRFRRGLVEGGKPTARHAEVAALNARVREIVRALGDARWLGVGASGDSGGAIEALGGQVTVGRFRGDKGEALALVVNRDHHAPARVRLPAGASALVPEGRAREVLELAPGDAVLLQLRE